MKSYVAIWGMIIALLIAGLNMKPSLVKAEQNQSAKNYQEADLKNGALLYDNWMKLTKKNPEGNHPLYPPTAKKSGKPTWRCK